MSEFSYTCKLLSPVYYRLKEIPQFSSVFLKESKAEQFAKGNCHLPRTMIDRLFRQFSCIILIYDTFYFYAAFSYKYLVQLCVWPEKYGKGYLSHFLVIILLDITIIHSLRKVKKSVMYA